MTIKQADVRILANRNIADSCFKLSFEAPAFLKSARPGQFLEIKVNDGLEPFLRKPLSIHRIYRKDKINICEVLYETVGEGTRRLSCMRAGEPINVIGPLGNGFDSQGTGFRVQGSESRAVIVAGGIGVAPLVMLAYKLVHGPQPTAHRKITVLLGAKTKNSLLCEKEFRNLGCEVKISTDDGSKGRKGFVTEILKSLPSTVDHGPSTIYACGPKPMLKEVARIAQENNVHCQVLLEEYMACGIGVCMGCAIKVRGSARNPQTCKPADYVYKMVCKDGPVFDSGEVIWE